jgi:outer membrane receptor protein involved in Fe transport
MHQMVKTLVFSLLLCLTPMAVDAVEIDTAKVVNLSGIEVVSTPKEFGDMRQQPSSVSVIRQNRLVDNQVTSLKGVSSLVPNFYIPDYGSRLTSAVYIRGVGSRINTPAVGLYVDNVPFIDKSAFDFRFFDIERVDVQRGPQGTLYGRNAMGGIIKVHTRNPFRYQGTSIGLGYASGDNHRNVSVTHNHLVSEKFAFTAGGYYEGGNGFFCNSTTGSKADNLQAGGGRIRGIYIPSSDLKIDMSAGYDYSDEGAYPYFYTGMVSGTELYAGQIGKINNNRNASYRRGLFNAAVNIEYQTRKYVMNAVTGYQNLADRMFLDQDFLANDIYTLEQKQRINTITEEVTFRSNTSGKWQWLTGANLMYQTLHTTGPVTFYADGISWLESEINSYMPSMDKIPMLCRMGFSGMGVGFDGDELVMNGTYDTPTFGAAIFHQSTYSLTDKFSVTAGLRLDYEHQQMRYHSPVSIGYSFSMPNALNDRMSVRLDNLRAAILYSGVTKNDYLRILPKLSLKYDVGKNGNIYASVAMGQRSGGYNLQMFSDLLQGALRAGMMNTVKDGVANYINQLAASVPAMPQQITAPDNPGATISLSDYVRRIMDSSMPAADMPTTDQIAYKPEYSWNFELGAHLAFFDNRLQADMAVFNNYIYDQQIARFAPSGLGRMMVNAGRSYSRGAELSLNWHATEQLLLAANYGFTCAKFSEYDLGDGIEYSGKYVPFVPKHTLNVDAAYTFKLKNPLLHNITIGANCTGAGRIYWDEANSASQNFYSLLGARMVFGCKFGTVTLWGKNLTGTEYNTFYFESSDRGFEQHGKPRQLGVEINLNI